MTLTRLAHTIVLAWGWRRILIAFLAGAISALRTAADEYLAHSVHHLPDPGLARRWRGRRPSRRSARSRDCRLVVRIRLFPRRPLLDRPCVPGRRQDLRLAATACGRRLAGRNGGLHRVRPRAGPSHLGTGPGARAGTRGRVHVGGVAARSPVQRLSLEYVRLRADLAALARARRGPRRHLGADLSRGRSLRLACRARRRPRRHQAALARAGAQRRRDRRARGLRRAGGSRPRRRAMSRACACASCSPTCSRTRSSTIRRSSRS